MSDHTTQEYLDEVTLSDQKLMSDVKKAGIDPVKIVEEKRGEWTGFSFRTGVAKAKAILREMLREIDEKKNAVTIKGIYAGSRDGYDLRVPVRMAILRAPKEGGNIEVSTFDTKIKVEGSSTKVELPIPSLVTLNVKQNEQYTTYDVVSVKEYLPLEIDQFTGVLSKLTIPTKELEKYQRSLVVVKGKVRFVAAMAIFDPTEEVSPSEKRRPAGYHSVLEKNARNPPKEHPVLQVSLEPEGNILPRLQFGRMRVALPTMLVEDLTALCEDAVKKTNDPYEQARMVGEGLLDRDVYAVGYISNYQRESDRRDTVRINASTLVDAPPRDIESLSQKETSKPPKQKLNTPYEQVMEFLRATITVTGISAKELNAKEIHEKKFKDKIPLSIVEMAIEELRKG